MSEKQFYVEVKRRDRTDYLPVAEFLIFDGPGGRSDSYLCSTKGNGILFTASEAEMHRRRIRERPLVQDVRICRLQQRPPSDESVTDSAQPQAL